MFPNKNITEFYKENPLSLLKEHGVSTSDDVLIGFYQSRLNTNLLLISNPNLISKFGLNYDEIVAETKKLFELTSYVTIPELVPEKDFKK